MMSFISKTALLRLREIYKPGTRVELVELNDPYRHLPAGLQGTVSCVDDTGTIHVDWDNGSRLGVVYGEDRCRKI